MPHCGNLTYMCMHTYVHIACMNSQTHKHMNICLHVMTCCFQELSMVLWYPIHIRLYIYIYIYIYIRAYICILSHAHTWVSMYTYCYMTCIVSFAEWAVLPAHSRAVSYRQISVWARWRRAYEAERQCEGCFQSLL